MVATLPSLLVLLLMGLMLSSGDWNGAGGHVNFSNNDSRAEGTGWDAIKKQISKLEKKHALHIASYGEGNERRLTGMLSFMIAPVQYFAYFITAICQLMQVHCCMSHL